MAQTKAGRLVARYVKSLIVARGRGVDAAAYAASQRWLESEQISRIMKASVSAHNTADQSGLMDPVAQDLAAIVRPLTLIGRMQGFRRIPANVNCISETTNASAAFLAEGAPVPLSAMAFTLSALSPIRLSGLAVVSNELALVSDPSGEDVILRDLVGAIIEVMDRAFADPENAGSPEIQPKSVTYDAQKFVSSGSDVASIDADLRLLMSALSDGGSDLQNANWVLNPRTAGYLASLRGSGGAPCFPQLGARGGELLGLPALISASIVKTGSPQETYLALVDASRIWLTESARTELTVSRQADLQMDNSPSNNSVTPTSTAIVSMFQTESSALRATQYVNWKPMTPASAAAALTGVTY